MNFPPNRKKKLLTKDHVWHTLQTAIDLMYKGTEEDNKMNYREALKLYEQAVEYFIHAIEYDVLDVKRKESIREKVHKFLNNKGKRAEAYNSYCEITLQLHKPGRIYISYLILGCQRI